MIPPAPEWPNLGIGAAGRLVQGRLQLRPRQFFSMVFGIGVMAER